MDLIVKLMFLTKVEVLNCKTSEKVLDVVFFLLTLHSNI